MDITSRLQSRSNKEFKYGVAPDFYITPRIRHTSPSQKDKLPPMPTLLLFFFLSLFVVAAPVFAHDPDAEIDYPATVDLSGSVYQDNSFDTQLDIDLPLHGGELFSLGTGYSEFQTGESRLSLYSASTGLQSDQDKPFIYGGRLEFWGNEAAVMTGTLALDLSYANNSWRLSVSPSYRRIGVYSENLSPDTELTTRSRFDIDNLGVSMNLSYNGSVNWGHRFHGKYNYFSEDMTRFDVAKIDQAYNDMIQDLRDRGLNDNQINFILNSDIVTFLTVANRLNVPQQSINDILELRRGVSQAATILDVFADGLALGTSFESMSLGYEFSYYWTRWNVSADITRSISAVTETALDSVTLGVGYFYNGWYGRVFYNLDIKDPSYWITQFSLSIPF